MCAGFGFRCQQVELVVARGDFARLEEDDAAAGFRAAAHALQLCLVLGRTPCEPGFDQEPRRRHRALHRARRLDVGRRDETARRFRAVGRERMPLEDSADLFELEGADIAAHVGQRKGGSTERR